MTQNQCKKILIVDDEAYIRLLIEQTLEDLVEQGMEIYSAEDGAQALQIAEKEKPGLIFLDLMMPKLNGFEVCRAIKHSLALETFIVILTAKGQEYDREASEEAGANLYMTKPFDPDELLRVAYQVVGD